MINKLRKKALKFGATKFGKSKVKNKRFYVIYAGKRINFGSATGRTFIDHGDEKILTAWRARHSKIMRKDGRPAYTVKLSPEWWSWNLLWT